MGSVEEAGLEPPLSVGEVANRLGVHQNTVKRIKDLPYFTINDRGDRRYVPEDVRRWIEQRTK